MRIVGFLELADSSIKTLLKEKGGLSTEQIKEFKQFKNVFFLFAQLPSSPTL